MNRNAFASVAGATLLVLLSACAQNRQAMREPPPPEPMPMPAMQKLSADGLFAFGKADLGDLSDSGRAELDDLVSRANASGNFEMIHIIGHSDRIGNDKANVRLSTRRANAVRDYMVERGIAADKITAVGRGSVEPVVECGNERGQALITCLAPNRRVEVRIISGG